MHEEVKDVFAVIGRNAPAQHVEIRFQIAEQREVLRLWFGVEVHGDPDLRQHANGRLADAFIVDVAVVGTIELDGKAVRIACFGHERFGPLNIRDRRGVHIRVPAVDERRGNHTCRIGLPAHDDLLDRIAVDGHRHGLAHAHIGQRVGPFDVVIREIRVPSIQTEKDHPVLGRCPHVQTVRASHPGQILHRHVLDEVNLAREQRSDPRCGVLDRGVLDARHFQREFADTPIAVKGFHDGAHVRLAADQSIGAGAIGVLGGKCVFAPFVVLHFDRAVRFGPTLVHDEHVGQVVGHDRVGAIGFDLDGVVADGPDLFDRCQQFLVVAVRRHRAVEREYDVFGGKGRTVMIGHTLAQGECPNVRVLGRGGPFGRERGHDRTRMIAHDQRFHDLVCQGAGGPFVLGVRIKCQRVAGTRPFQGLRADKCRAGQQHRRRQECREFHNLSPRLVF
mmetsp:Transcript_23850/g.43174  ORF Transcript_23850/g.43174 Transcript_23850/m.43174 type:complete len:448 (+) Transcript_23850:297-1640(+)